MERERLKRARSVDATMNDFITPRLWPIGLSAMHCRGRLGAVVFSHSGAEGNLAKTTPMVCVAIASARWVWPETLTPNGGDALSIVHGSATG